MKLDLLNNHWLEIVFEGRNKSYGAYDLRKSITKRTLRAFVIGTVIFVFLVSIPTLMRMIPDRQEDVSIDKTITAVKLPPKKEKPKENLPPPPPPPPKVDQVKFVKPVVARADEVVEEIAVVKDLKDKNIGKETIKGDPNAELTVEEVGHGDANAAVVEEDNSVYNTVGIEQKPDFPGGMQKFYDFIGKNYVVPEGESINGKVFVSFVVEKDGSLTDIKVIRDMGYGTGKEAERVLRKCPRWTPGEQNGKKVRCAYSLPISIQSQE